jgi:hypothetical protein
MRLRLAVLASLLTAFTTVLAPSVASAAPKHNHDLTIRNVPSRIMAGEPVLIYGHLSGPANAGQLIRLYHRVNPHFGYSLISTTHTDASGFYEFTRADGIVDTNRSWFVRGPDTSHSRTVYEGVQALVSLSADKVTADTRHPIAFTGAIDPAVHPFQRISLQVRNGTGDDWRTVKSGFTRAGSSYRIDYRWSVPGAYDVRTVLSGDRRDLRSYSAPVSVTVQQAERPFFSVASSDPVIQYGSSATISGVLDKVGTTTPDSGVPVTLLARTAGAKYTAIATTTTPTDGSYSFSETPQNNTLYVVQVTLSASRHTSALLEVVRDVVSATPSATSSTVGATITFTGSVLPGKSGGVAYLQRLGADGDWHTIKVGFLNGSSAYSIAWTLGDAGTDRFRVRVLGDRANAGGASAPMAITVAQPPASTLPPAS